MTTYTWIGANAADWSVAGDWSQPGGPPGISDVAFILSGATVDVGEAQSVDGLNLAAGAQLLLADFPFTVAGSIDNGGLIVAGGTLVVAGSAVTLSGGGTLALSGANDGSVIAAFGTGDALLNDGAVITGTGTIGVGGLGLTNEALGLINAASIDATAATLSVGSAGVALSNSGLIEATTAALAVQGDIANSGTIAAAGGTVTVTNATISGGTLAGSGGGLIVLGSGATLDGSSTPVTNTGSINAGLSGVWVNFLGTIVNQGTMTGSVVGPYNSGANLMLPATVVFTGGGTVVANTVTDAVAGAVLVNASNTITGGDYNNNFLPDIVFDVNVTNEAAGVIDYGQYVVGVVNNGTIANSNLSGVIDQTGGGTISSFAATINSTSDPGGSTIGSNGSSATIEGGTIDGLLTFLAGGTLDGSAVPVDNAGSVVISAMGGLDPRGAVASLLGSIDNTGTITVTGQAPIPVFGVTGQIQIASPTVTLGGGGQVQLFGPPGGMPESFAISGAATGDVLVNVNDTISGQEGIGTGGLVLENQAAGLIDATGTADMTLDPLSLSNAGTLEATTGQLVITTPSLTNTGTLEAAGDTLDITAGTFTDLTGTWIADNSVIALPNPNGFAGISGQVALVGTGGEFVSSTGTDIPSLTNSYLAPETILAGGLLGVYHGAEFGIGRTPTETIVVGGNTVVTGNSLQPFGNAGSIWLYDGTADLVAFVTNSGRIFGYGTLITSGAVMNNTGGTLEAQGGSLVFQGALSGGQLLVDSGATLELSPNWFGGGGAVPVSFDAGNDLLQIDVTDTSGTYSAVGTATVNNFVYGDTIAVDGTVAGGGVFPGFSSVTNDGTTLAFIEGGTTLGTLGFTGGTSNLVLSQDANHDEIITVACFAAGTRILTHAGEIPVEALRIGDRVPTLPGGRSATVRWLGYRQIECARHVRPQEVWPVRVQAGAFAPDTPRRDLFLSPDHAVFLGGVLIPVRYLVNGISISQIEAARVEYWHVELDRHAVLLADWLPAESYLDTGNRSAFADGGHVAWLATRSA
jgi:hypothetical protein